MIKKLLLVLTIAFIAINNVNAQSEYVLQFDAVTENQSIKYNDDATTSMMDGATDYTIEMWVKPNDDSASYDIWLYMRDMFKVVFYSNNRFYFQLLEGGNTYYNVTDNAITINEWNHIAIVCNSSDGANGSIKLYVNGVDKTFQSYDAKSLIGGAANNDIFIGYGVSNGGSSVYANMLAREIRIKKTAEDVANFHTNIADANYTTDADTTVLFNFAEGTGLTTVNAASGVDANFGYGGAHYPTWVLLSTTLATESNNVIDFSVYPNPTNDVVNIKSNDTIKNVSIYNILGKMVYQNDDETINLSNLNTGIYLIKVETTKGIGTRKLVIK